MLLLGLPSLAWILLARGGPRDPVPRGGAPADALGLARASMALLGFVLLYLLATALLADGGGRRPVATGLLLDTVVKGGALGAALLLVRRPSGLPLPAAPAPAGRAAAGGALAGIAFLPVMVGTVAVQRWLHALAGTEMEVQPVVKEALEGGTGTLVLVTLFVVVAAPLFEEVFFRGFLHVGLRAVAGPGVAAVVSAAAFGAFHGQWDVFPVTFLLGLALARLRERTGGLAAPMAMHACYNAFQVAGIVVLRNGGG